MEKLKVAVVIPAHFDIHSSLHNLIKVYRYLIKNKNKAKRIAVNGRRHILKNFATEKVALKIYKTFAE